MTQKSAESCKRGERRLTLVCGCLPDDDEQAAGVEPKCENLVRGGDSEVVRNCLREFSGGKVFERAKLIEAKPNPKRRERFSRDVNQEGFCFGNERDAADEVNSGFVRMDEDLELSVRLPKAVEQFEAFRERRWFPAHVAGPIARPAEGGCGATPASLQS
jgi:hypothetical protein